jgi:hypothetical protein
MTEYDMLNKIIDKLLFAQLFDKIIGKCIIRLQHELNKS